MATVAIAIVIIKPLLAVYPLSWVVTVRMFGGNLSLLLLATVYAKRKEVWSVFRPSSVWKASLPASVIGMYLALTVWMLGFKYTQANIAGLLNQTSTLWTVLWATMFLKEPMTRIRALAMVLAVLGSALIILG
jgi:drug/metabolite transporter (DMT)-like permease